jgi:hypothetical protein
MQHLEPTRVRENGTRNTTTKIGSEIVAACREVKTRGQYAKGNGTMIDLYSASAIIAVHDGLNAANRLKFYALPVATMARVSFALLK